MALNPQPQVKTDAAMRPGDKKQSELFDPGKRVRREIEQQGVAIKQVNAEIIVGEPPAERVLKQELTRARPGYGLLFEESGETVST